MVMCCHICELDRETNAALLSAESAASMAASKALNAGGAVFNMPKRAQALLGKIEQAESEEASWPLQILLGTWETILAFHYVDQFCISNYNICNAQHLQEFSLCSDKDFYKEQEVLQGVRILLHICNENLHSEGFDIVDTYSMAVAKSHGRCPAHMALEYAAKGSKHHP